MYYIICVTIEAVIINPSNEQAQACLQVCQWLSNCYKDIHLFRFDTVTGDVYILAGDELEILVPSDGLWYFL
ncbi:DUF6888 family protein [Aphanothece sacrum]|uniref:Two-component sensor histidine kinase n=1 Tax=Aphanothece sacrum FPU1 TaxID=1920663 RepID=A0A401IE56_APHSA|nr:two-component sensor histidine kinase [Aphanothece sacrum FPU1]GBF83960.1 two-component sensor histidine kinase [Aphanothece sacrum FPU3]